MRREIAGIVLLFVVFFSLIALVSYHPADPSINHATHNQAVHNLFGVIGAYWSGILIGLFGLGAYWVPVLLALMSMQFFSTRPNRTLAYTLIGGFLLTITTGALLALKNEQYIIFGISYSAGGLVGMPVKALLMRYANTVGSAAILGLIWLIGLIMATGFSPSRFAHNAVSLFSRWTTGFKTVYVKRKERKQKAKRQALRKEQQPKTRQRAIAIKTPAQPQRRHKPPPKQEAFAFMGPGEGFHLPSVNLLDADTHEPIHADRENLKMQSKLLEKKLQDFGVNGQVVAISPGPVITTFEYEPAPGVKINKVVNLTDDLALALRALSIRIVAPIPGKAAIGIEIPNSNRQVVKYKGLVASDVFQRFKSKVPLCLGRDIVGDAVVADLAKMPHLLIAGATGAGKSVGLNAMICSLLFKSTPEDVKMIMVDPKRIELSIYDGIPHLITPVVTDAQKATNALFWAVREMECRYELLSNHKVKNIAQFNQKIAKQKQPQDKKDDSEPLKHLPLIVIIIDELADLMMVASRDVELALTRLAQMARAAGIHLILATQRPSVDVLTGIIKANFPTRLTYQVSSKTDSRTIIDTNGAETLLGNGDMLFMPPGTGKLQRIHGAYITEDEIAKVTAFLRQQQRPDYDQAVTETPTPAVDAQQKQEHDERYDDAVALVAKERHASISMIQRHLRIGYNRAARIIETMEKEGIVGPADGAKPREVLVRGYDNMP
jgi:S-DNA-T family DNA segregation ATPase FtsK/SpoIIIE